MQLRKENLKNFRLAGIRTLTGFAYGCSVVTNLSQPVKWELVIKLVRNKSGRVKMKRSIYEGFILSSPLFHTFAPRNERIIGFEKKNLKQQVTNLCCCSFPITHSPVSLHCKYNAVSYENKVCIPPAIVFTHKHAVNVSIAFKLTFNTT